MDFKFLVTPIICGIVGYFTNYIAIKMLFLPRYEKRILGFKVPFTPGLLPKSKARMASTIGNTVSEHLLNPESIKESLLNSGFDENIENTINEIFENTLTNEKTLREYYSKYEFLFSEKTAEELNNSSSTELIYNNINSLERVKLKISTTTMSYIDEHKSEIISLVFNEIKTYAKTCNIKELSIKTLDYFSALGKEKGKEFLETEDFKALINNYFANIFAELEKQNKPLNEIIPSEITATVKSKALDYMPKIADFISNNLLENEEINQKLLSLTEKIVRDSVGSFVGSMVYKKVYESIKESALTYINDPENLISLFEKLSLKLDDLLNKNTSELVDIIPKKDEIISNIKEIILNQSSPDNLEKTIDFIYKCINDKLLADDIFLYDLLIKILPNFDESLIDILSKIYDNNIRDNLNNIILIKSNELVERFMDIKICDIVKEIGEDTFNKIKAFVISYKDILIEKGIILVSEKLDVKKTVEDKINDFEVEKIEEIVLNIANKELNYITILGGVLGFIVGFVPLLFN